MALPGNPLTTVSGMDAKWSAAIGDLYQACHLRPPAVVLARDAVDLARLTSLMTPACNPAPVLLLITLLALLASVALILWPGTASLGALLSADFGLLMVPVCTLVFTPPNWRPSFIVGRAGLRMAVLVAVGFLAAWLHGGGVGDDLYTAAAALGLTGAAFLISDLMAPVRRRRSACTRAIDAFHPSLRALFGGFRPVGAVVHERLRSALSDLDRNAAKRPHDAPIRDERQRRTWNAVRGELERLQVTSDASPALGRSVGADYDQAAQVSAFGLFGANLTALPHVLRAAVMLDGMAAAVCALEGITIVLPLTAPDILTAPPIEAGEGWRRSRRAPWHAVLNFLDEPPSELILAIDLAPGDAFAARLLARRLTAIDDPACRVAALQTMGVVRVATALRLHPVHEDAFGRLFHFGQRLDPSAFVAVRDQAVEADGTAIEHWIGVPPHMATAREAVAWTFGMSEHEYRPMRET